MIIISDGNSSAYLAVKGCNNNRKKLRSKNGRVCISGWPNDWTLGYGTFVKVELGGGLQRRIREECADL